MPRQKRALRDLTPNPRNPRRITDAKRQMLKDALARFGDISGVVFNRRSQQLVGGHQRVVAFTTLADDGVVIEREHAEPTITGTVAEGYVEMAGERFAYREVDWNAETEKAANLAANKGAGEWDVPQLTAWMGELEQQDFALDLTMFDAEERAALDGGEAEDEEEDADGGEDALPELPPDPVTQLGDLYVMGAHRLLCGDARDAAAVAHLMDGAEASMVYTDPPYGMRLDTQYHQSRKGADYSKYTTSSSLAKKPSRDWRPVEGDHEDFSATALLAMFPHAAEVFLWGADYYADTLPRSGSWVVWDKRSDAAGNPVQQFKASEFELCWSREKHHRQIARVLWSGILGATKDETRVHPTQKPVKLHLWFFQRWGKKGDVVVDLYGGSGSTLLACEKAERQCRMMELDPAYCDVIVRRWEESTGLKAERIAGVDG